MNLFQSISYQPFTPRNRRLRGKYIVSRSGILFFHFRYTFFSAYWNPVVRLRLLIVSLASLVKRGAVEATSGDLGIIHSGWTAGYFHWITESLPRALIMRDDYPDAVPTLPSEKYRGYVDSLECLGFSKVRFYPVDRNLIVKNPILTECPKSFGTTSPHLLRRVRDLVLDSCSTGEACGEGRIIYVSRKKARGRYILNEGQVANALQQLGAEVFCFEDLSFHEQVDLMSRARILISIHGAALTNMMFMKSGAKIVELLPKKNGIFDYNIVRNSFKHDPCYVRLAGAMGHEHFSLQCIPDNKWHTGTHMANLSVDVRKLSELIRSIL